MEYVELWYFTTEGILDASKLALTTPDESIGLIRTETGLAIQPIKASKASRNAILDESLSWEQIVTARHNVLDAAAKWPEEHQRSMAEFYMNLEALKATGTNPRVLILYHAVARRQWHISLKGEDERFNIAKISQELLTKLESQLRDLDLEELRGQASKTLTNMCQKRNLTSFSPPCALYHPPLSPLATLLSPCDTPLILPLRFAPRCCGRDNSGWHPQMVTFSRRNIAEPQFSERDRGRSRRCDRGPGRQRSSRSRSPIDQATSSRFRRSSPGPETTLPACPVCLSRKPHSVRFCRATTIWNGKQKTVSTRDNEGKLLDKSG